MHGWIGCSPGYVLLFFNAFRKSWNAFVLLVCLIELVVCCFCMLLLSLFHASLVLFLAHLKMHLQQCYLHKNSLFFSFSFLERVEWLIGELSRSLLLLRVYLITQIDLQMDRASILGDAIDYMKELLQRISDLHNELESSNHSSMMPPSSQPPTPITHSFPCRVKEELSPNSLSPKNQPARVTL